MHSWSLTELFSRTHIQQLAQEIMKLVCAISIHVLAYVLLLVTSIVCDSKVDIYIVHVHVKWIDMGTTNYLLAQFKQMPRKHTCTCTCVTAWYYIQVAVHVFVLLTLS